MSSIILVNFGGPRSLQEVPAFLTTLLTDVDVIRTSFPRFFEQWFFRRVALKRVEKICKDYELIGGKSPIFEDTEALAEELRTRMGLPVITFHRYLPATHAESLQKIRESSDENFIVLPLYPQFSYATTGSIARFFQDNLEEEVLGKMRWIKSFPSNEKYISAMQNCIRDFLNEQQIEESNAVLFFSAHGLPQKFVDEGDPYEQECNKSYEAIRKVFPKAHTLLAFQSKFGKGEWLRPYTNELCEIPETWSEGKKHVVFVPLSFTSDHIETLYEIEYQYLPVIRDKGLNSHRCPALNRREDWIEALTELSMGVSPFLTRSLIRY